MQITFDPYNPVERAFVASVVSQIGDQDSGDGFASVEPAAASGEEGSSSFPDCAAEGAAAPAEKPKRTRRTKAEIEAARAAEQAAQPAPEPAHAPDPFEEPAAAEEPKAAPEPAGDKTYTQEEVRAALQRFTAAKGLTAGIDLLASYGVRRISDLDPSNFAAVIAKCAV
jgi:hypothetical protein